MKRSRDVLAVAVERLVEAAGQLGAVPVDLGDVRALSSIVGAQARVVEALARLDSAEDRRRTGRVQRDLLRARLAQQPNVKRNDRGAMVVYLPHEDEDLRALPDEELHRRIAHLAAKIHEDEADGVLSRGADLEAVARAGLAVLVARVRQGDRDAAATLAPVVDAAKSAVVLPPLEDR